MIDKLKQRMRAVAEKASKIIETEMEKIKVSEEQRNERYDICKSCEHLVSSTSTCRVCFCFMSAKTYLAGVSCPLKKWDKVENNRNDSNE